MAGWFRFAAWPSVCILSAFRFAFLTADFPNDSPWMIDQAKFTDEGWWGSAAVAHALTGRWYVRGDYNPAVALPVWPTLLGAIFHFSGVSLVAARALNVSISLATLVLVFFLVRRFTAKSSTTALLAVLLLAASPFAFAFSRLAILDSLVVFEFCLALFAASFAARGRLWPLALVSLTITAMMLTKTTAAMLLAAIFVMTFSALGRKPSDFMRAAVAVVVVPGALLKGYEGLVSAMGYAADYKYFFSVNAMPEIDWPHALDTLGLFFQDCIWVDRVLYPAAFVVVVLALIWGQILWRNALFTASWMVIAAQAVFIFSRQDDVAPRYFLVMLAPMAMIVVLALDAVTVRWRSTGARGPLAAAALLGLTMAASLIANATMIGHFLTHRDYDLRDAAAAIEKTVRSEPEQKALILGVSGNQISLMTGIPAINDGFGTEEMAAKVAGYQPGWYLAWNDVASEDQEFLSGFRIVKIASFPVFDDEDRNVLTLYKLVRRDVEQMRTAAPSAR